MPVKINGATNGSVTLAAPATGSDVTLTLPAAAGTAATTAYADTAGGLQLITPTGIANSGGSASVSGGEVTFTGVSSVSLNGVFTSAFTNYRILVSTTISTGDLRTRLRAAGTDNTAGQYALGVNGFREDGVTAGSNHIGSTSFYCGSSPSSSLSFDALSPQLASITRCHLVMMDLSGGFFRGSAGMMTHNVATALDGITFFGSAGNLTGTVAVYGYRK